jgi:hypothetical protein
VNGDTAGTVTSVDSRSILKRIFIGEGGFRAGWRFGLFNSIFFVIAFGLLFLRRTLTPGGFKGNSFTAPVVVLQETIFLIALVLALAVMLRIEKRPFKMDFLPLRKRASLHLGAGVISGLAAVTLLIIGIWVSHAISFDALALHGYQAAKFASLWAAAFLLVGVYEESFSRGYAQATLTQGVGFWPAALITSVLFAAIHLTNSGESALGILSVFCIAMFFCFTVWRTGALWFAVGFHAAWDYGETFIYGVPDSAEVATGHLLNTHFYGSRLITGGSVGPEGSVLVFVVYAVSVLVFALCFRKNRDDNRSPALRTLRPL